MFSRFVTAALAFTFVIAFAPSLSASGGDDPIVWRPVTQEELQMKTPKVEADADAEAIFWEVRLDDKKDRKLAYSHYVRLKIFTERGRERFSKMEIPFANGRRVENVAARVIRPDGSIITLKPEDIFELEIAKAGKARVMAKSFAIPGIEPGVIVEYQYSETIKGDTASGERLVFQRDIPLQKISYYVRPHGGLRLSFRSFNMSETRFTADKTEKGFLVGTMYNVPAFKEEPYMPPDGEVLKWVYLSYPTTLQSIFQWSFVSAVWAGALKKLSKPNKEVKAMATKLTAGASTDEEKLRRIYSFVQNEIKNVTFDRSLMEEQVEKMDIKDADDALRQKMGRAVHIDLLFASLAKAAGFEAGVFLAPDRGQYFFTFQKYPFPAFIQLSGIGVKVGGDWKYFDPCKPFLPFGQLPWNHEGVQAMVIDESDSRWTTTPITGPEKSPARRTGKFTLSTDGTLEGTVKLEFEGHQAISRRRDEYRDSQGKREENLKREIKVRLSMAEISGIVIENFDDNTKPLTYSFRVRVPNYAAKTGKRLIVQPGFFEHGSSPVLSSATRLYQLYFPYPWSEEDLIEIRLPDGYTLDHPEMPGEIADAQKIGRLKIVMSLDPATNVLRYDRRFHFGGGGNTLFPVASYRALKGLFDLFHKANTQALSIKAID